MLRAIASLSLIVGAFLLTAPYAEAQQSISHARALAGNVTPGDAPGYPVTISVAGSFVLSSNLAPPGTCGAHGIDITSGYVNINLNGFAIVGPATNCADGVRSSGWFTTVTNGNVSGFSVGLRLQGFGNRIERVEAHSNRGTGIQVGATSIITDSSAVHNQDGISAGSGALLLRNTASSNQRGIVAGPGSNLLQNTARDNLGAGFQLVDGSAAYAHNVLLNNGSGGPQVVGGTALDANACNGATCP
jgi:hypothetical protein